MRQAAQPQSIWVLRVVSKASCRGRLIRPLLEELGRLIQRGKHIEVNAFGNAAGVARSKSPSPSVYHLRAQPIRSASGRLPGGRDRGLTGEQSAQNLAGVEHIRLPLIR